MRIEWSSQLLGWTFEDPNIPSIRHIRTDGWDPPQIYDETICEAIRGFKSTMPISAWWFEHDWKYNKDPGEFNFCVYINRKPPYRTMLKTGHSRKNFSAEDTKVYDYIKTLLPEFREHILDLKYPLIRSILRTQQSLRDSQQSVVAQQNKLRDLEQEMQQWGVTMP